MPLNNGCQDENGVMYQSKSIEWETPPDVFNYWDKIYQFTLDVCATNENKKVMNYFSPEEDGLTQDWGVNVCWMNPPYGKEIIHWVKKASEAAEAGATVVALLPARTDTKWFHTYVLDKAHIHFLKGRITFVGAPSAAPFPSMICVWLPGRPKKAKKKDGAV